jgi:UDP-N-acetyl-D-glucosamine dehydrogenase
VLPILAVSGLQPGRDFFLAYSPEREDAGNTHHSTGNIPKLVGGVDAASMQVSVSLYQAVVTQVVPVASCEIAEAAKLLENTYRAVNIALVNELKKLFTAMGLDVWQVIDAARTKPFGFAAFEPGPGLGGHCIPIDPFYLSWLARQHGLESEFIELAGEVNTTMPEFVVDQLVLAIEEQGKQIAGSKICILGVAYKRNVDDPRESPSFRLIELLTERGATISYNDPHIPTLPKMRNFIVPPLTSRELTPEFLACQDCVLIAADHTAYDYDFIVGFASIGGRYAKRHAKCNDWKGQDS